MAVLEKIRGQKALLTGVVGGALLLFVFTSVNGCERLGQLFGDGTSIAIVDGKKIDYKEYQDRLSEMQLLEGENKQSDSEAMTQQAIQELMLESLLNEECDDAGIYATDAEVDKVLQLNEETKQLIDAVNNPQNYNINPNSAEYASIKMRLDAIRNTTRRQILQGKAQYLLAGSLKQNKLEEKFLAQDAATYTVDMAMGVPQQLYKEEDFEVSDNEIKERYDKEKALWKVQEETRYVTFIVHNVQPSQADVDKAQKMIAEGEAAMRNGASVDELRVMKFNNFTDSALLTQADVKDLAGSAVGAVKRVVEGNKTSLYKVTNVSEKLDSVRLVTFVAQGDKALQDSVFNLLRAGQDVAAVKGVQKVQEAQDYRAQTLPGIPATLRDSIINCINAGDKAIKLNSSDEGAAFLVVEGTPKNSTFYTCQVAEIETLVSRETEKYAANHLQNYANNFKNVAGFKANAQQFGWDDKQNGAAISMPITASMPNVNGLPGTRDAISWAMQAKVGEISPLFTSTKNDMTTIIVAAVESASKDGYITVDDPQVREYYTEKIRTEKMADQLAEKVGAVKATSLDDYAKAMSSTVQTDTPITPCMAGKLGASMLTAKDNVISAPIVEQGRVVVYTVKNRTAANQQVMEQMKSGLTRTYGNLGRVLMGGKELKNNSPKMLRSN